MGDGYVPDEGDCYAPAYTPTTARSWHDYLEEAKICELELTEDACNAIARGFTDLAWDPSAREMAEFRQDFEPKWREALVDHWKANVRVLDTFIDILRAPGRPMMVGSLLRSMTDGVRKELKESGRASADSQEQSARTYHRKVRVPRFQIPIEDNSWKDYTRCHLNTNLNKVSTAGPEELASAIRSSGLKDLLRTSMVMADICAEHFTSQNEPGGHLDDLSHREDWTEFQARAQELREVIETLQSRDPVELICGTETGMEELHSAAMATFVAMAIYFGHFEARYMIGWHSTATGKCKGYRIGKLRDNLKQLEDPTAKMLAAGQLIAALGNNLKRDRLRIMEELALWSATEVPALMTPFTHEIMRQLSREQWAKNTGQKPLRPPKCPYAGPPAEATIYGKIDAPLAGILDKTATLDSQMDTIAQDWAAKVVGKTIAAINACTTVILTLNELPTLRNAENMQKCYKIPRNQKKFLSQSLFTGAAEYVASAERAGDHDLEPLEVLQELKKETQRLISVNHDIRAREFCIWVETEWDGTSGLTYCGTCQEFGRKHGDPTRKPPGAMMIGDNPLKCLMTHLLTMHSTEGKGPSKVNNRQRCEKRNMEASRENFRSYGLEVDEPRPVPRESKTKKNRRPSSGREDSEPTARSRSARGEDRRQEKRSRKDRFHKVLGHKKERQSQDWD